MAITIALLQGINVGKNKRISMADFKDIIARLGGANATTVANSGNVVFTHDDTHDADQLRILIEKAVSDHVGMPVPTVTRTETEMARIVAANPYPDVTDTKCLHVVFLLDPVPDALEGIAFGEDHLTLSGREIYMHLPNKMSGQTHDFKSLGKKLGTHQTSRNWNTVTKLNDLAANLNGSTP